MGKVDLQVRKHIVEGAAAFLCGVPHCCHAEYLGLMRGDKAIGDAPALASLHALGLAEERRGSPEAVSIYWCQVVCVG
jgi:hypothetical protein